MKKALDISKWQGSFCAEKARAAGIDAVICRCAYAASEDSCWEKFAPPVFQEAKRRSMA